MGFGRTLTAWVLFAALGLAAAGCGGDDGDGGSAGSSTSQIGGNVAAADTASAPRTARSTFAWVAEELLGFARKAYAQVTGVGDIEIEVLSDRGGAATAITDSAGNFDVAEAPIGNLLVRFRRDGCEAEVPLPDVPAGAKIVLLNVAVACDSAEPDEVSETFEGVVTHKPGSPEGNLQVCMAVGDETRERVVKVKDATFETEDGAPASFDDLAVGDAIGIEGVREGKGASSAIDARLVTLLGPAEDNPCAPGGPAATATPETTPGETPTAGLTATPTSGTEATPTPTAEEATPTPTP